MELAYGNAALERVDAEASVTKSPSGKSRPIAPEIINGPMRVRHVMSDPVVVTPNTSVADITELMVAKDCRAVSVIDGRERLIGIVTESDLYRRAELGTDPQSTWLERLFADSRYRCHQFVRTNGRRALDVMSAFPVTTAPASPLRDVADLMFRRRLRHLPVVVDRRVVGMVTRFDLVHAVARAARASAQQSMPDAAMDFIDARIKQLPASIRMRIVKLEKSGDTATIAGWAASDIEKRALHVVAENIPGVTKIRDEVRPMHRFV